MTKPDTQLPSQSSPPPVETLANTRTFRDIGAPTLEAFVAACTPFQVPAGEVLFRAGDAYPEKVYVLLSGDMVLRRPDKEEVPIQPGDLLGLANYLDQAPYHSTVIANSFATVLQIPAQRLQELEQTHPDLFNAVNRIIAAKLRERRPTRSVDTGVMAQPVSRIMKSPLAICGPNISLLDAFSRMQERRIGSLVVTEADERLLGILTFSGLAEAVLLKDAKPQDSIIRAACETAHAVAPDTPLWKAEEIQQRRGAKYLLVVENGHPVGMISQTDILRAFASHRSTLSSQVPDAKSIKELLHLKGYLVDVAEEARETHRRPSSAVRLLSEAHLAIQRRVVELTLERMKAKGLGTPPTEFAVLIMGSGGRKEMLLNPDQDNGLIIADEPEARKEEAQIWFHRFAKRLNKNLDRLGYPLCPGDIMARNPLFRKPLQDWCAQISHITEKPTKKAARWSNVILDFDTLYGDDHLTAELRRHTLAEIKAKPRLLSLMTQDDAEGRPAIGFFNQLVATTKDDQGERIDLKRNGLRIIADAARIYALQAGVTTPNTLDRLLSLVRLGKLSDDFATSVAEAYDEMLHRLLAHQIQQARHGKPLDKLIDPEKLSPRAHATLRIAMRAVKRFQDQLQGDYGAEIF